MPKNDIIALDSVVPSVEVTEFLETIIASMVAMNGAPVKIVPPEIASTLPEEYSLIFELDGEDSIIVSLVDESPTKD